MTFTCLTVHANRSREVESRRGTVSGQDKDTGWLATNSKALDLNLVTKRNEMMKDGNVAVTLLEK